MVVACERGRCDGEFGDVGGSEQIDALHFVSVCTFCAVVVGCEVYVRGSTSG